MISIDNNRLIGASILSTFSETKKNDSVDLMISFIKFSIHQKYNHSDTICENDIAQYICSEFSFDQLPTAIIHKGILRLSKSNNGITRKNGEYNYC